MESGTYQYSSDLAGEILDEALACFQLQDVSDETRNEKLLTCANDDLYDDPSFSSLKKEKETNCVIEKTQGLSEPLNVLEERDKTTLREDVRERFVQELCCDIFNGALESVLAIREGQRNQKFRDPVIGQSVEVFTERTEGFCPVDIRPTIVIKSTTATTPNVGSEKISHPPKKSKKRKSRQKKKLEKELAKLNSQRSKNSKFLTVIEEEPPLEDLEDRNVLCPICLDVYFNAYTCKPCDHTFCEPCLRRLAKYCSNAGQNTNCPICREPIHHCQKDYDFTEKIRNAFPHDHRRRGNTDAHSRYMQHPLPSQPTQTVDSAIISNILRRRQQERQRARNPLVGYTPVRINFRRYVSLAAFFVIIKALALMVIVAVYSAVLVE